MCDFIAWALNDFDINPSLYNSMDKQEVKLVTDKIIDTNSNDNNNIKKNRLAISQNILVQMKTKRVRFADKNSYCIF
jgi:peptidase E|tara:strand:+ start:498 stop:728 length:231 start_codon:yes stop_codon:yes gene_type:complete